ncbi:hypothetical protein JKF63_04158 [Porcisia hertigi]|uniref:Uncharacterized protein n=1 Tax=Porcisia hertigi TaxID=2761500 RepID=A0A836IJ73_9TRYP|nr:hypothetical protein JKF63_04158 [Porcisia hertigi]
MYTRTTPLMRGLFSRKQDMQSMVEGHFWSLTRYRILPRFLGLDFAGNVIFFPAHRKQSFGGWTAVTLGAPGSQSSAFLSSDMSAVNVLEDGYPMHYKASRKLQTFVAQERQRWQKKQSEAAAAAAKKAAESQAAAGATEPAKNDPSFNVEIPAEHVVSYGDDQQFRDLLAIKCSQPRFYTSQLRVSNLATITYKCLYFYLWAVFVSLVVQGYLMFRAWVNPPAREGLKNIEEHVLHIPRLLFSGCVYGLVWLVRTAQPVIDPVVHFLTENFPQVNWGAASAENLASRAQNLADDAHPKAKERRQREMQLQLQTEAARRTWWARVLMVLLVIFSILCVL